MRSSVKGIAVALLLATAGCQTQPATIEATSPAGTTTTLAPEPVDGIGYVVFNAPIVPRSRDLLLAEIDRLVAAGARNIHIGFNSPGGQTDAAQGIVQSMNRLNTDRGITFEAYNMGLVASAASYVFLNAQRRYASPGSAFLFHAAGMVSSGAVQAQQLREGADKLDAYERLVRATMKARTRLTPDQAAIYVNRTVLLNADDAQRDGVIDAVAAFSVPPGARSAMIASAPRRPARPSAPPG